MDKKYVQKVIPRVSTEDYSEMTVSALLKEAKKLYEKHCRYKVAFNKHIGISIQLNASGRRKTVYGEALYSKKVAIIPVLETLLVYGKYNNFGSRKSSDPKEVIGYYNFKSYVYIDGKKECVRLAVRAYKNGTFYYNVEVNKKPDKNK